MVKRQESFLALFLCTQRKIWILKIRLLYYLIIYILKGALLLTCDSLFSTRDPEPPNNPQSSWEPPLNPEQVLVNMQNAVFERNTDNFMRCLIDPQNGSRNFSFIPDQEVSNNYPGLFTGWAREDERRVTQQIFAIVPVDSALFLTFPEIINEIVTADTAIFIRQYHLEVHHTESAPPVIYEGQIELWLADVNGEWSIYRWIDIALAEYSPWTLLKAALGG